MIYLKSPEEVNKIRQSCRIVAMLLAEVEPLIRPGISTWEINEFAEKFIREQGAYPSFKGYRVPGLPPYPDALCISINDEIVHGIPSKEKILQEGDIVSIDAGAYLNGYHGDGAKTYAVGKVSEIAQRLLDVTKGALAAGIEKALAGNRVGDISHAIETYVRSKGFYPADDLTGHGIGRDLHEAPQVPNIGSAGKGPRLQKGMTIAIEPMVNVGTNCVKEQGWEFRTADNSLSAHFEHTILITDGQPEILTSL
ncbi:MAG TPA: type I methionyl aminopeptidase [Candidatus Cloacimonadota bacterium]|nr:type I methionyl aminopeptidase [Candidatus Cloacimonadota bacterium]HOV17280.1 type I methionyl aminopeptidase [Candidatus Cloacimonadota bacterium]HQL14660.1 type I methionyl aminopeptidase [Candidatus Cloacimonadota bacterium]